MDFKGRHLILSLRGIDKDKVFNNMFLRDITIQAVKDSGATILGVQEHEFEPYGYSAVVLISESHASIHTFPEHGALFADYFTCGSINPEGFGEYLVEKLQPKEVDKKLIERE